MEGYRWISNNLTGVKKKKLHAYVSFGTLCTKGNVGFKSYSTQSHKIKNVLMQIKKIFVIECFPQIYIFQMLVFCGVRQIERSKEY